jgi:hypothetical protein
MDDPIRIGAEPPPTPPPRPAKVVGVLAGLVLLASAGAWLAGALRDPAPPTSTVVLPPETTTTDVGGMVTTSTAALEDRLRRAVAFWAHLGAGEGEAALAAVPAPSPGAADLVGFVAAFSPGFTVTDCREFAANAVECLVTVTAEDLLAIGLGTAGQRLLLSDDGWFDLPAVVASSTARLSLHALSLHADEVRAACPLTDAPQVSGLAIVGSPTAGCGAYLAALIPEYLGEQPPADGRP